jgi:hypothetical protein
VYHAAAPYPLWVWDKQGDPRTMEVGSPEWIEASLARLDELERERAKHEAALETVEDPATLKRHTEAFTRLDTEIKSLYAQLEAVADDDDEGDDESEANDVEVSVPRATQGDDELSAPHISAMATPAPAAVQSKPVAKPIVRESDNPFGSPSPSPSGGGGFDAPAPISMGDDDIKPAGGGAKWALLALVVIGGVGVGGYFVWQDMQSKKAPAAPTSAEPDKVIRAVGVPDDTEAPPTAPSGHATISPNANPTTPVVTKKKKEEEEKKPLKLKGGDGPL